VTKNRQLDTAPASRIHGRAGEFSGKQASYSPGAEENL
jgi:hypothetical protein